MNTVYQSKTVALLCGCLLVSFAAFNFFLRSGFNNNSTFEVFNLAGLGLFFLFLPSLIARFSILRQNWMMSSSILSVVIVFITCCAGYLNPPRAVSILISSIGFLLFLREIFNLNNTPARFFWPVLALLCFFSIWTTSTIWGGYHLRPTFIETLVVSKPYFASKDFYNTDTLFNISIAQMIKNYGVPSLGLDGLPIIRYHYGSHWIMAQLSNFSGIHLVYIYNYGYPLILIPLFFKGFIEFSLLVQHVLFKRTESGFLFLLILMCLFIQVPNHEYSGGLLGISGLVNDSFTISLLLIFIFLHMVLLFSQGDQQNKALFIIAAIALIGITTLVKISAGFVLTCLTGYLFLRLRLYRDFKYWLGAVGVAMVSLITLWFTAETLPFGIRKLWGDEGVKGFFHFYKYTHNFRPVDWFLGFYFWMYLVIAFVLLLIPAPANKKLSYLWKTRQLLPLEISILVALVGVAPSLILVFNGGNSMYFSGIQLFVAGSFTLAFIPAISDKINTLLNTPSRPTRILSKGVIAIIVVVLLLLMYVEVRWQFNKMIKINILTRREILGFPEDPEMRVRYGAPTFGIYKIPMAPVYDTIRVGKFINALIDQEKTVAKNKALFLNHQALPSFFFRNIQCIETSFIAPAFSGYAMIDGVSYQCHIGMYGESYFKRNFFGVPNPRDNQICEKAAERGFSTVVKFSSINNRFESIGCTLGLP